MVLRNALAFVALVAAAGCIHKPAVVRLPEKSPIAVAFVRDAEHEATVADVPEGLKKRVLDQLTARNLDPKVLPFDSYGQLFGSVRDSQRRLARLTNGEAPLVLLVETKAVYFSALNGRFRWVVYARFSLAKKDGSVTPLSATTEQSAFVDFAHEKEPEALMVVADPIAERVGVLLDDFLGGEGAKPAASASDPRQSAIYFVMVDRFANGDRSNDGKVDLADPAAFHGGDLQGVIDHLDELKALGVGTLWLSPVFQMRTEKFFGHGAFHGYWTEDLTKVEPRFGDTALLRRLSDELRRRDMRLMLDLVLNHVAMDAPLTKTRPNWFHNRGPLKDWNDRQQLENHDVHGLPDLAQERGDVYAHLLQASLRWVEEVRPHGFRLDAVKHVPLSFWTRFNDDVRAKAGPQFLLLGEMLDGDAGTLARTQREGRFGAMFDFPLYFALVDVFCREKPALKIGAALSVDRTYDDPDSLVTLLDNHDLARVTTDCGGDLGKVQRALTVQLTARGTPALTWGIESALAGAKEPENRGDMRFDHQPLREHISRIMALRRAHPALWSGAPRLLSADEGSLVYARVAADEVAIIAVNQRAAVLAVELPEDLPGDARDALAGTALGRRFEVPGREVRVALIKGDFRDAAQRAQAQWRRGEEKRTVEVEVASTPASASDGVLLVGAAPELGSWDPARGARVEGGRVRLELAAGGVYDFKVVVKRAAGGVVWEDGDNRSLVVPLGAGPLRTKLSWNARP